MPVTVPTYGLMLKLVAPLTFQVSLLELPFAMLEGLAAKLLIVGGDLLAPTVTEPSLGVPAGTIPPSGALKTSPLTKTE